MAPTRVRPPLPPHAHRVPGWLATLGIATGLAAGCATTPQVVAAAPEAAPLALSTFEDVSAGVAFEVPSVVALRAADGAETLLALGEPSISMSLFHEHFEAPPDLDACWARLEERVRSGVPADRLPAGPGLRAVLSSGLERGGGRVLRVAVRVRGADCVIVTTEGPLTEPLTKFTAEAVAQSLRVAPPAPEVAARLAYEAGMQLLSAQRNLAALERLQEASRLRPGDPRTERAAGLAAFFASGKEEDVARKQALSTVAVKHLGAAREAWRATDGVLVRPFERDDDFLRDVLMYLGLAQAALGAYAEGTSALGELVVRHPEDAVARYNFACVLALGGDGDEAMVHLREAVQRDPSLAEHARSDGDLVSLRGRGDFQQLVPGPEGAAPSGSR